jgi:hypothetical protein
LAKVAAEKAAKKDAKKAARRAGIILPKDEDEEDN